MPELAVIVPTLNERDNVEPLLARLGKSLAGIDYEVIFVDDDSEDGTAELCRRISLVDSKVRVLQRIGRRGLSSACIEGMLSSAAPYLAVMDGDLQHDEGILPRMLQAIRDGRLDIVVASRHVDGGDVGNFSATRQLISNAGKKLSDFVMGQAVSDPMSGFFVVDRRFLNEVVHALSLVGFKILVDLLASSERPVRIAEVPYTFRERAHGQSKLDVVVGIEYLFLLADKLVGHLLPVRFAVFALVGVFGLGLHLSILGTLLAVAGMPFLPAHMTATLLVMTSNFLLNNTVTYRDRRLKGWQMIRGLLVFYAACSIGALSNFSLAQSAQHAGLPWYVAGFVGMIVNSVWNYGVTSVFSWRQARQRTQRRRTAARVAAASEKSSSAAAM
ncbi:MAG: glycosyltransferase family 2 protein [Bryobacteraceae bacterium]|nr:glycosyltransferase family 2 protein [Bryobacteraceae bacterium]